MADRPAVCDPLHRSALWLHTVHALLPIFMHGKLASRPVAPPCERSPGLKTPPATSGRVLVLLIPSRPVLSQINVVDHTTPPADPSIFKYSTVPLFFS
jgi:hypothetical protein